MRATVYGALLALALLAGCSQNQNYTVSKHRIEFSQDEFHQSAKDKEVQADTQWFFHCSPALTYETLQGQEAEADTAAIKVKFVKLDIGLSMKERLKKNAGDKLRQHEQGHIHICERIYAGAEDFAQESAKQAVGRIFTGAKKDKMTALQNAVVSAEHFVCDNYKAKTAAIADQVSRQYDALTQNGVNNLHSEQAVEEAFKAVR